VWLSLACAVLAFCVRTPLTKFWSDSDCGETRPFEFEMLPTVRLAPLCQEGPGGGIGPSAGFIRVRISAELPGETSAVAHLLTHGDELVASSPRPQRPQLSIVARYAKQPEAERTPTIKPISAVLSHSSCEPLGSVIMPLPHSVLPASKQPH